MIIALITSPKKEAKKIARILLNKRLCACINIINSIDSLFLWHGKIDTAKEALLIAKTADHLFKKLEKEVLAIHPYDIPEVVNFKLNNVSKTYKDWLEKELNI